MVLKDITSDKDMGKVNRQKIIVYGAGNNCIYSFYDLDRYYNIVSVIDADATKHGKKFFGKNICGVEEIQHYEYDKVVVTPSNNEGLRNLLENIGVQSERIYTLQEALDDISTDVGEQQDYDQLLSGAIVFYGGMGDLLIGHSWLVNLQSKYKSDITSLDLYFSKGLFDDAMLIFSDIADGDNLYCIDPANSDLFNGKKYGLMLRFCIVPEVWHYNSSFSAVFSRQFVDYITKLVDYGNKYYNRGFFTAGDYCKTVRKQLIDKGNTKYHMAYDVFDEFDHSKEHYGLCVDKNTEQEYLSNFNLTGKKFITINTGLNKEYEKKANTRAWSYDNWKELSVKLKELFPDITIVQVGVRVRDEDDIPADIHLNGKTDLEEIAILLKNAFLHIDYDGGLVHVRHIYGGKSIVLMGPSSSKKHDYPENIYIQTGVCSPCEWITGDWLSNCPHRYEDPICMSSITVEMVSDIIVEEMKK